MTPRYAAPGAAAARFPVPGAVGSACDRPITGLLARTTHQGSFWIFACILKNPEVGSLRLTK